jgi:serine protease inhibitor
MKTLKSLLLASLLSFSSCTHHDIEPGNISNLQPLSSAEVDVSSANNDFAFNLFRDIQNQNAGTNLFISPLSVSMALGMAMNGASSSTQQSILNTIQFGSLQPIAVDQAFKDLSGLLTSMDRTVEIDLANSVWYDKKYTVIDTFAMTMQNYYGGTVQASISLTPPPHKS